MLRVQPSGVMTYYFAYRAKGGRKKRIKIGRGNNAKPAQARDLAEILAGQVVSGKDVQANKKQARCDAEKARANTLKGFLEHKYGPWVKAERKTGADTVRRIESNFSHLFERPLMKINTWVIDKWRTEQIKSKKAKTTINRDVVALKACISKAVEWGLIEYHPLAKVKPLKTDKFVVVRYLTPEEEIKLRGALIEREERIRSERNNANDWRRQRGYPEYPNLRKKIDTDYLKPMALLTINTGLRIGEALKLKWAHINFRSKIFTVHGDNAKSGHSRHIPLNDEAMEALTGWRTQAAQCELIFTSKDGRPLGNVRKSWHGVLIKAGISNFRWHDLRHHFASKLAMAGVDLNTIENC